MFTWVLNSLWHWIHLGVFKNSRNIWDKVFKNGLSTIFGRQPLKNLKWRGLTIGVRRVSTRLLSLAYTWFWTCVRSHVGSFFLYNFLMLSIFFGYCNVMLFKNLLLYIWSFIYLFLEETDSLLFTFLLKGPYFSIFYTNYLINVFPYLRALANLECQ